jgi:hypothetical protein
MPVAGVRIYRQFEGVVEMPNHARSDALNVFFIVSRIFQAA